eukprot:COSAG02_NODE_16495_length_1079_cov_0.988776_1_plen_53_part_10
MQQLGNSIEFLRVRVCIAPSVQCRLTAGIPTILLEQKVLGQPFSKDNSTSIVI